MSRHTNYWELSYECVFFENFLDGEENVGPVGIEPTTHGLKVRCSTD
jgi:hypothetical protein